MAAWGGSAAAHAVSGAGLGHSAGVEPGRRIGRYELEGELGRGGMGQVLAARDRLLDRTVALKRVLPGSSRAAAARLAREARITGLLEHPGVVPVLDAGYDDEGVPFYVMRLIRGRTLAALLGDETPHDEARTLRHVLAACEAVAFAHELDIVHRDLKAENILVGEFGETQVADWGLARQLTTPEEVPDADSLAASPEQTADDDGLTRVGAIIGTPASMSPEQARGEPAGKASDVYSLGLILWQFATGQRPYASGSGEGLRWRYAVQHRRLRSAEGLRADAEGRRLRGRQRLHHRRRLRRGRLHARRDGQDLRRRQPVHEGRLRRQARLHQQRHHLRRQQPVHTRRVRQDHGQLRPHPQGGLHAVHRRRRLRRQGRLYRRQLPRRRVPQQGDQRLCRPYRLRADDAGVVQDQDLPGRAGQPLLGPDGGEQRGRPTSARTPASWPMSSRPPRRRSTTTRIRPSARANGLDRSWAFRRRARARWSPRQSSPTRSRTRTHRR